MRKTIWLTAGLVALLTTTASAQRSTPNQTQLRSEIRSLLLDLRTAAARRDWSAMEAAFPASGHITARTHDVVLGGPEAGGLSFWTPNARPNFDELVIVPVRSDLVAISLPFADGESTGAYGTVFERRAGSWQITCFQEAFPVKNLVPGCVPDVPDPQ